MFGSTLQNFTRQLASGAEAAHRATLPAPAQAAPSPRLHALHPVRQSGVGKAWPFCTPVGSVSWGNAWETRSSGLLPGADTTQYQPSPAAHSFCQVNHWTSAAVWPDSKNE